MSYRKGGDYMNEQIELDKLTAKEALARYLKNFLTPDRNTYLEDLIVEIAEDEIINVDWIEIY